MTMWVPKGIMKVIKKLKFDSVAGMRFGYGYIGRPFMNVYCFSVDGMLIDTAQSLMRKHVMDFVNHQSIHYILLTHYHEDHSGNAAAIQQSLNVPVYGHPITKNKLHNGYKILPYQHVMWGKTEKVGVNSFPDIIEGEQIRLEPIHTPGHSKDHTVFYERNQGWLFSGDLFLSERIKYFRSDENFHETVNSLKKVLSLDFESLFCAHKPQVVKGKEKIRQKLEFLENFQGEVSHLYQQGYDVKSVAKQLTLKEDLLVKYATFGTVSLVQMIRAALVEDSVDGVAKVVYTSKDRKSRKVFNALDWLARLTTHIPGKTGHA